MVDQPIRGGQRYSKSRGEFVDTKKPVPRREWKPDDRVDSPECGFYLVRLTARGPLIPARIFWSTGKDPDTGEELDRPQRLCALAADEEVDVWEVWHGRRQPTTQADYEFRTATIRWARAHKPELPECNPRRPVDMTSLPPIADLAE